jgi:hypothetical protein
MADRAPGSAPFNLMTETLDVGVRRLPAPTVTPAATPAAAPAIPATASMTPMTVNLLLDNPSLVVGPVSAASTLPAIASVSTDAAGAVGGPQTEFVAAGAGFAPPDRGVSQGWFPEDEFALSGIAVG